jgi:hypothetical protein
MQIEYFLVEEKKAKRLKGDNNTIITLLVSLAKLAYVLK